MTKPMRLQLRRVKGFDLQAVSQAANGLPAKSVGRPSIWGNPFAVDGPVVRHWACAYYGDATALERQIVAAKLFSLWLCCAVGDHIDGLVSPRSLPYPPSKSLLREQLRGHNLACYCQTVAFIPSPTESRLGLIDPCHADVLLQIANA